ncbi:hypothetical protein CC78DRAFT_323634 [Lojkania enalia]|uniref:Uncharacterized protein n=1 Tax=Lojkania enalia TaxID=147567 RepID=A0A9P4K910_9PLEO|nr:hypothetical protein CC78DRAFT_323634 [Didymosphaeria enalia]
MNANKGFGRDRNSLECLNAILSVCANLRESCGCIKRCGIPTSHLYYQSLGELYCSPPASSLSSFFVLPSLWRPARSMASSHCSTVLSRCAWTRAGRTPITLANGTIGGGEFRIRYSISIKRQHFLFRKSHTRSCRDAIQELGGEWHALHDSPTERDRDIPLLWPSKAP